METEKQMPKWLLYGAYGFTGRLLVEEAVKRGHRPVLAGRNAKKLAPMAEKYDLDHLVLSLEDETRLADGLADFELVLHAAGPHVHTAGPMIRACLAGRTHYLDITGEIPVFENTFTLDDKAKERRIALISGVGFDVVPTSCLSQYVVEQLPGATKLEMAVVSSLKASAGTTKTLFETLPDGDFVRRSGQYRPLPFGQKVKRIPFSNGKTYLVVAVPWGDLATAYWGTGIPNITTYLALPPGIIKSMRWTAPIAEKLMSVNPIRRLSQKVAAATMKGPDEVTRQTGRSYIWARAADEDGNEVEAWLETLEPYRFTAVAGVRSVESLLEQNLSGALSPAQAFGADFVLEIEGTERIDKVAG